MHGAKPKIATATLLAAGVLGTGAAVLTPRSMGDSGAKPEAVTSRAVANDLTWVEKRVQEWQPTAAERGLDKIGWARDIREAQRLSKKHGRPVFLFTHDGRMGVGRC